MEYFIMRQDDRILHSPQLMLPKFLQPNNNTSGRIESVRKTEIIYVKEDSYNEYPGYIETPIKLISGKIKRIVSKYQQDIVFKPAILVEKESNRQEEYHIMALPEIECAADSSICDADGNIKEFVLDEEKVKHLRFFIAKDCRSYILVRLDLAESILRRGAYGIWFEEVNMIRRGD